MKKKIYLKLEGIDTREAAIKLTQKEIWLPEADFKNLQQNRTASLLGYTIINNKEQLG